MKLPALLDPARIGAGGHRVRISPFPTPPEIAVTLVNPAGTVAPSPTTVPSLLSASPDDTATTLLSPSGTLMSQPDTVPSLRNSTTLSNPPAAMPVTLLAPGNPPYGSNGSFGGTTPSLRSPTLIFAAAATATKLLLPCG